MTGDSLSGEPGTDRIVVRGLRVFGYHGVNPLEREKGQYFVVDVEAEVDLRPAGATDRLEDSVDYSRIIREIQGVVADERFALLEALAERIAQVVLERPAVAAATVRVAKPDPPTIQGDLEAVMVQIRRTR